MISLLVLGWVIFIGQPTAISGKLRALFTRLGTPLVKLGGALPTVASRRSLAETNKQLLAENERLHQQLRGLDETVRENQRLHRLLDFKPRVSRQIVGARVIGHEASNWWRSIQIDRGVADGIRTGFTVATADGLVGKVVETSKGESRVLLLLDPTCQVGAILAESRYPGVVKGAEQAFVRQPRLEMMYVERSADLKPGELVLSSGHGGIFPKGLPIGKVVTTEVDKETGMFQRLSIAPTADFRRLEEVVVMFSAPGNQQTVPQ